MRIQKIQRSAMDEAIWKAFAELVQSGVEYTGEDGAAQWDDQPDVMCEGGSGNPPEVDGHPKIQIWGQASRIL